MNRQTGKQINRHTEKMAYLESIQYLESFINYEKVPTWPYRESLKLERIKQFLEKIGSPQDSLDCIHIAGTKGKGSTCAFVAYILRQAGYQVGLYTSPHLVDFRERIRILKPHNKPRTTSPEFEGMISKVDLANLVEKLKPRIERYNQTCLYGPLSFFEVYTALAFLYFKEKKVDFAVLETGLGGRLDATNVVEAQVVGITPISYEHAQKLGATLKEIATEKAGIIKRQKAKGKRQNLIVISAPQKEEVRQVIRNRCQEMQARLYEVGKDISYKKAKGNFLVKGLWNEYLNLKIRLMGEHQLINAAVAVGIIEALQSQNVNVTTQAIRAGFYATLWPGRCEVVAEEPKVILDGAQNVASARALKETIRANFQYKKLVLVIGISSDKDIRGICNELRGLAGAVVVTQAENPRALTPEVLARYFDGKRVYLTQSVKEAKAKAYSLAEGRDLVLVTGSLFVVGEFRNDKR